VTQHFLRHARAFIADDEDSLPQAPDSVELRASRIAALDATFSDSHPRQKMTPGPDDFRQRIRK